MITNKTQKYNASSPTKTPVSTIAIFNVLTTKSYSATIENATGSDVVCQVAYRSHTNNVDTVDLVVPAGSSHTFEQRTWNDQGASFTYEISLIKVISIGPSNSVAFLEAPFVSSPTKNKVFKVTETSGKLHLA